MQAIRNAFQPYLGAVRERFGSETNYGVLRKIYGKVSADNWYGRIHENWKAGLQPDQHIARRTYQPKRENAPSQIHSIDECGEQDVGKLARRGMLVCGVLQLRAREHDAKKDSGDGCWFDRPSLDDSRTVRSNTELGHYREFCTWSLILNDLD
jgi:hypothetical protein